MVYIYINNWLMNQIKIKVHNPALLSLIDLFCHAESITV